MESDPASKTENAHGIMASSRGTDSSLMELQDKHDLDGHYTNDEPIYFSGARFYLLWTSIIISLFVVNIEVPIVTTSVATITNDLGGFDKATWITSAYLLGYVGVLIIWAKLSDILSRKLLCALSLVIFIAFSAACGAAQNLTQLIIFRAFQGIGGGGAFAVCNVIGFELVPESKYAAIAAFVAFVYGITLTTGPIIGGAISKAGHWRWVFWLNIPPAALALLFIVVFLPNHFPHHGKPSHQNRSFRDIFKTSNLARVDVLGVMAIWLGVLALVAAVEQAGISHRWNSAFVITTLIIGVLLFIFFLVWERLVTRRSGVTEPVFPWHFATSRIIVGVLLAAFSQGMPWIGTVFQLPQKFQTIHAQSPVAAGIKTIPFTVSAPIFSVITAIIAKKGVPPIYIVVVATVLQIVGFALLGNLPLSSHISKAQYGYQVIAGASSGTNSSLLNVMAPLSIKQQKDKSVIIGAFNQFRYMGGAIGLAIISTAMSGYVRPRLSHVLTPSQVSSVLDSAEALSKLDASSRDHAITILAEGYNLQFKILAGLASLQLIGAAMMWQKHQIKAT